MVAGEALIYHPSVSHYLRFVATTVGRDKLLRLLQYYARFYAWYLYRTNAPAAAIAPYEAIKRQFGLARKLLRLGKSVEHLRAAAQAADAKSGSGPGGRLDRVLQACAVGRQLGYAAYFAADNVTVIDAAGIRPFAGAKRFQREAQRAWFSGLTFSIVAGIYTLYRLRQRAAVVDRKEGEGAVEAKKLEREGNAAKLQLIQDLCDITVPTAGLGLLPLDDGLVGLAGTLSSMLGIYSQWKKTT